MLMILHYLLSIAVLLTCAIADLLQSIQALPADPLPINLLNTSISEINAHLANGSLTSVRLVQAYLGA